MQNTWTFFLNIRCVQLKDFLVVSYLLAALVATVEVSLSLHCQIMDGPGENDPDLVPASHPRFCEAIKTDTAAYTALFTRTFQNKTFHVYRVKKKHKKSPKSSTEPSATQ